MILHTGLVKFYYNNIYTKDKKKEIQNDGLEDGYNVVVLKERQTQKKKKKKKHFIQVI